jgi:hypothetical protein
VVNIPAATSREPSPTFPWPALRFDVNGLQYTRCPGRRRYANFLAGLPGFLDRRAVVESAVVLRSQVPGGLKAYEKPTALQYNLKRARTDKETRRCGSEHGSASCGHRISKGPAVGDGSKATRRIKAAVDTRAQETPSRDAPVALRVEFPDLARHNRAQNRPYEIGEADVRQIPRRSCTTPLRCP